MYIFRLIILAVFIFIFKESAFSQKDDSLKYIKVSAKYATGYIYAHHQSFKYFINDYVPAFEANIGFRKKGDKIWHQLYRYPVLGFGYYHAELGNPEVLGHVDAIFPYINISILEKNKFKMCTKFAVGVAWLSKSFDLYNNNYNIAIGSKLNTYININLESKLKLAKRTWLLAGLGMTHYSNGGMTQPNKGINIFSASAGVLYNIQKKEFNKIEQNIPKFIKKNEYTLILSAGTKTLEPARTHRYLVSSLSFNAERQFSFKGRYGIGIDIFKDNSREEYLKESEDIENPTTADLFYAGGHASYDFVFGKTSFTVQMGGYFLSRAKFFQYVYHRFGF
ncbi:MAG: hypothetical protein DRJ10_11225, partial [Bacteroidetes bacterium]